MPPPPDKDMHGTLSLLRAAGRFCLEVPAGRWSKEPPTHLPGAGRKCWGLNVLQGDGGGGK